MAFDLFGTLAFEDADAAFAAWKVETEERRQSTLAAAARADAEAVRERCKSLVGFVREAWQVLEPVQELKIGWAVEAMAEHLEAVTSGDIKRLIINVPPGLMKSLLTSVFWPAWEWGPAGKPSTQIMGTAHGLDLATRDSRKMKALVESEWYQALWGDTVQPGDKWGEAYIENNRMGWRKSVAFSRLTGGRGNRVIVDDPLSTEMAESDADRETAERITRESLPTRLNDQEADAIVLIMQRLHEQDPAGILQKLPELGYVTLCLPMEFEPDRRCVTRRDDGSVLFVDPREEAGELLFEERYPRHVVDVLKASLLEYGTAGQLQQRPAPREGGLFKTALIGRVAALPFNVVKRVRAWDFASATGSKNDFTAGFRVSKDRDGAFYIEHGIRAKDKPAVVKALLSATASADALLGHVPIRIPEDPGSAGIYQRDDLLRHLAGYSVTAVKPTGSKVVRATPLSAQVQAGNVYIVETGDPVVDAWIKPFIAELSTFPAGANDDQVDAVSDAFNECAGVVAGEGLMEYYRRLAEAARNGENPYARAQPAQVGADGQPDDGRVAVIMPPDSGSTFHGIEGDRYTPDAAGRVRVKPCDLAVMQRHGAVLDPGE